VASRSRSIGARSIGLAFVVFAACSDSADTPPAAAPLLFSHPDAAIPIAKVAAPELAFGLDEFVYNTQCVVETFSDTGVITVPERISETGCYADPAGKRPAPGLIPFGINYELWTDGAFKRRFFALPEGTRIGFTELGAWEMPVGTILMKEFILEAVEGDPSSRFVMETRFFIRSTEDRWRGYSYQWDDAGEDAALVDAGGLVDTYEVRDADGGTREHEHLFPSQLQCLQCHSARAGGVLGMQTPQMNRSFDYGDVGGRFDHQLRTLEHLGVFRDPIGRRYDELERIPSEDDTTASLEVRARSFLHANCSHCHNEDGSAVSSTLYVRWETPLTETNACDRIRPGDAESSELTERMTRTGTGRMPPIGTRIPDPRRDAVFEWVRALDNCP
jgi:uncharacterized repeat protein (TIGR03806 family)